jgi:hypothetical protein
MGKKLRHLWLTHLARVTLSMEPNEPFDPVAVRLLRPETVMLQPHHIPHLIEQPFAIALSCLGRYNRPHEFGFYQPGHPASSPE